MLETHAIEREGPQVEERNRIDRLRLLRHRQDLLEHIQRRLGFAVDVDDVAEFLKRAEDEERVDEQREELPDGDRARVNQIQHQEHDAGAQKVDRRPLDEAEASQVPHLLQLQPQNFLRGAVQARDLLLAEAEAFHELDIAQATRWSIRRARWFRRR